MHQRTTKVVCVQLLKVSGILAVQIRSNAKRERCMDFSQKVSDRKMMRIATLGLLVLAACLTWSPLTLAQQNNTPDMQDMPGMDMQHGSMSMEETPAQQAKRLSDKRES